MRRSDIYALGATLYHLMTGVKPPDALTRAAAIVNGQEDPLRPANEIDSSIGPEVARVAGARDESESRSAFHNRCGDAIGFEGQRGSRDTLPVKLKLRR